MQIQHIDRKLRGPSVFNLYIWYKYVVIVSTMPSHLKCNEWMKFLQKYIWQPRCLRRSQRGCRFDQRWLGVDSGPSSRSGSTCSEPFRQWCTRLPPWSISSTFYARIFCTKVLSAAFFYLHITREKLLKRLVYKNGAHKMLMIGTMFFIKVGCAHSDEICIKISLGNKFQDNITSSHGYNIFLNFIFKILLWWKYKVSRKKHFGQTFRFLT